ncbi:hypothetical protein D4764_03G0012770 [Takifugu flavidus]|uniref:Uncharacterized protein n=2 Tax=Takifugu flavidus TaxID=433684 RepID=A0A5C6NBX4_9TELE|nr:hypothetical protein D4764_03G0012770 [Takifugu flavidus]
MSRTSSRQQRIQTGPNLSETACNKPLLTPGSPAEDGVNRAGTLKKPRSTCHTLTMMSEPAVVERPALEDVAEEEDAFAAEGSSCCQVVEKRVGCPQEEGEKQLTYPPPVPLAFRKQVSYR